MKYFLSFILFVTISKCQEIPFKVGELLKYSAQFELIPVGEAELFFKGNEKFNDIDVYHVSWKAYTKGLASTIFKIQDKIDIWIDKKDFFTHRLKKNINEGSYSKKVDVKFTSITFFHSCSFIRKDKLSALVPALLIKISKPPNSK